jgi:hypothetical protein
MGYQVAFVLDSLDGCQDVLDAWEGVCIEGITILESTGIGRIRQAEIRDDIPQIPSLSELLNNTERHNRTLFSGLDGLDLAHDLVGAVQNVVGDLDKPNSGSR